MASICVLVTPSFPPILEGIKVVQEFGPESIVDTNGCMLAGGIATMISGEVDAIRAWLKPLEKVWTSDSPITGRWEQLTVK